MLSNMRKARDEHAAQQKTPAGNMKRMERPYKTRSKRCFYAKGNTNQKYCDGCTQRHE